MSKARLSRAELQDNIETLRASLKSQQARHYNSLFPDVPIRSATVKLQRAERLKSEAVELIEQVKIDVAERVLIERKLIALAYSIKRLEQVGRKQLITSSQMQAILKAGERLANKIVE